MQAAALPSPSPALSPALKALAARLWGAQIGSYRVQHLIGYGGMGAVFAARHQTLDRRAAVKVLVFSDLPADQAADAVKRFLDEAKALSTVRHAGLVQLFDSGQLADGTVYILMEYLEGESLAALLGRLGRLPLDRALGLLRQIASALCEVHGKGIVHRDLTPNNLFLVADERAAGGERVKLVDFGIAKIRSARERHTKTGECFGTPRYMAPEQCEGSAHIDDRADIYTLGVLLFELLTGRSPYQVESGGSLAWMYAHVSRRPWKLTEIVPTVPAEIAQLVADMLDKVPAQRPSAAQVVMRLRRYARLNRPAGSAATSAELVLAAPGQSVRGRPGALAMPRLLPTIALLTAGVCALSLGGWNKLVELGRTVGTELVAPVSERATHAPPRSERAARVSSISERAAPVSSLSERATPVSSLRERTAPVSSISERAAQLSSRGERAAPGSPMSERAASASSLSERAAQVPPGMVLLRGQGLVMGSSAAEVEQALADCQQLTPAMPCRPDSLLREQPTRRVTLRSFYIDQKEVTNREYADWLNRTALPLRVVPDSHGQDRQLVRRGSPDRLLADFYFQAGQGSGIVRKDGRYVARPEFAELPVVQVTWHGAREYCEGQGRDLPSEAQWEFAARQASAAADGFPRYPWGDDPPRRAGVWMAGADGDPTRPRPVGTAPQDRTPSGIFDLGGNVSEWVRDRFVAPYPDCGDCVDPVVAPSVDREPGYHVIRGGSFTLTALETRSATRSRWAADVPSLSIGFRCAAPVATSDTAPAFAAR